MLVLSRKVRQRIVLLDEQGREIVIEIRQAGSRVKVGVQAPATVKIVRGELQLKEEANGR